jgi:hypothetical protein
MLSFDYCRFVRPFALKLRYLPVKLSNVDALPGFSDDMIIEGFNLDYRPSAPMTKVTFARSR